MHALPFKTVEFEYPQTGTGIFARNIFCIAFAIS